MTEKEQPKLPAQEPLHITHPLLGGVVKIFLGAVEHCPEHTKDIFMQSLHPIVTALQQELGVQAGPAVQMPTTSAVEPVTLPA